MCAEQIVEQMLNTIAASGETNGSIVHPFMRKLRFCTQLDYETKRESKRQVPQEVEEHMNFLLQQRRLPIVITERYSKEEPFSPYLYWEMK